MNRRSSRHGSRRDDPTPVPEALEGRGNRSIPPTGARSQKAKREPGAKRASYRLALKIAARTSVRSLSRSALIATMVALPIAGLAGVSVVYASGEPTYEQIIETRLGQNEASVGAWYPAGMDFIQDPTGHTIQFGDYTDTSPRKAVDVLPSGTRILALSSAEIVATTASGRARIFGTEGAVWDPAFTGIYDVIEGRAPRTDREIMVTPALLPRLGVAVGDTVDLHSPESETVTVVGVLDAKNSPDDTELFFARDAAFSGVPGVEKEGIEVFLPDLELDWEAVQKLNEEGMVVVSRAVLSDPPPQDPRFLTNTPSFGKLMAVGAVVGIGGAFAIFEVILLAGAAFTVTARQQQRTLATLASVGSPRRLLFRVLTANGIVLGAIGGIPGVAVGVAGAALFMAMTSNGSATQYYGFHVPWLALLAFVAFAAVIGWLASLFPARSASRFDIVAALRGSRKPPPPSKRKPVIGISLLIVGIAAAIAGGVLLTILLEASRGMPYGHPLLAIPIIMLVVGPIAAQAGLILCGPLLLRLIAKIMSRSGVGARLASRDAARNPSRAVPALAAIMTTVFVAAFAMCMVGSAQASAIANHQYQLGLGQVGVSLTSFSYDNATDTETVTMYPHADSVESAMRSSLEVDELSVLASVPNLASVRSNVEGLPEVDSELGAPLPGVPAENLCPTSPRSVDYTGPIEDAGLYKALESDWRCKSYFPRSSGPGSLHFVVGDVNDLALVLNRQPSDLAQRTLETGGAVSLYQDYVHDGEFTVEWWQPEDWESATYQGGSAEPIRAETLDAVVETPEHTIPFGVFISPATADRLGLDYEDTLVLASTAEIPSSEQRDALYQALSTLPDGGVNLYPQVETGPQEFGEVLAWGLLGLAALIAIASAGVAIGLARFDGRQDDATLGALGARRLVRKNFAFWQAIIIAGVGALLGAGMGLVPALALSADSSMPFAAPWLHIGVTAVALPLLIACGSWVFATGKTITARRMSIA